MTGQRCYETYCVAVGHRAHDGRPLPPWRDLGETQRRGWNAVAAGRLADSVVALLGWIGLLALGLALLLGAGGCTVQDQLAAAKGALGALRAEQAAETARDPVRAYYEERNMSEAAADLDELADWCEEARDRWGDDALDDSPTYDQVCEQLLQLLAAPPECPPPALCPAAAPHTEPRAAAPAPIAAPPPAQPPPTVLPPAAAEAEGLHDPPAPGAVSGDLHAGHGVNLTAATRALERELWAEARRWAALWTQTSGCRDALAEVHYALGAPRIRGFARMLGEVRSGDWAEAAYELRASEWARTVGARAERIAATLEEDCP